MSKWTETAWREICPWLILLRTFRLAVSLPVLGLATAGALLTPLGWTLAGFLFLTGASDDPYSAATVSAQRQWPDVVATPERLIASPLDARYGVSATAPETGGVLPAFDRRWEAYANVPAVFLRFVRPFHRSASSELSWRQRSYLLLGGTWNLALWAFLGGAITRIAVVQLGRNERLSLAEALRHTRRNYGWYLVAPFFPLVGVVLTMVPMALLGLLMRLSMGALIGGVLWVLVLVCAFTIAVLLLGAMFGWPLMWPTISADESCDAFEAFSRSYSYTFQRPLHYLGFSIVTVAFGALCWLLVSVFSDAVVELAVWGTSWGAGEARLQALLGGQVGGIAGIGAWLMQLAHQFVYSIAAGFNYGFFFCNAAGIYLLLRSQVDQTEMDEVFVEEEADRYGLPVWRPELNQLEDQEATLPQDQNTGSAVE